MNDTASPKTFLPYGRQQIDAEDEQAVLDVLRGDWLTTGPAVDAYEEAFADRVGAQHAVACSSGTAGLHMAAIAIGLDFGDVVVVPSVTFLATANAVRYVNADVLFADVDPETGLVGAEQIARAIAGLSEGTVKAIFPVHLTGHTVDIASLRSAFPHLAMVEDACHALGGEYDAGKGMVPVGSCPLGGITMFSTHPVKTIATGEGGVLTTNSQVLANRLRWARNHGMVREPERFQNRVMGFENGEAAPWYYEMHLPGYNYRLSDVNAALGLSQLRKLDRFVARRRALRQRYAERIDALGPHVAMQKVAQGCNPAWHLAVALIDFAALGTTRTAVMNALRDRGIGTQVHYIPVHRQPYYAKRYGPLNLPGADAYYARCLSLPLFPAMEESDVDRVVDELADVLKL
ncbi:UDP-4-amino-4,6-dideoxy-N-acetyl-beta-L-altrosamine transaminase [Nisaea acidiphila]|uniref:UDP-4-amino-4, 6-dideoxy-N-acetyl-beta-L-altrosamine transaminase n=1 Tax=Nisaea acidiphila TaxID=1862145 RepID=A0A9J7AVG2_9PROT|nr:UDP-4-amino-4,6-dideoxy-N-acetyl-beta-L-altrosamine transaminase [Nisaea acidiphila]UUX49397.1 UDP-4-amino-4,6-dideoxy-N-acetyl-beta-L-altrosamine transaminase [Nisaea acidiphila]